MRNNIPVYHILLVNGDDVWMKRDDAFVEFTHTDDQRKLLEASRTDIFFSS